MVELTDLLGFETRAPSHQNALDLFPNSWSSKFPPPSGLKGGEAAHFDDVRVTWAASLLGGLQGRSILELGPFEAYNTYQFQMAGAGSVTAIESSRINFLKCLVVKNIFGLNATILHGDFQPYLAQSPGKFDICWASGVLYHMTDPLALLRGIRAAATTAFIWTHYYDEAKLTERNNLLHFDPSKDRIETILGRSIRLHHRNYLQSAGLHFSGGDQSYSYWLERDDIIFIMAELGYDRIDIGVDNPDHPPGPAMFFMARTSAEEIMRPR